ncbi:hypothetical protein O1611_g4337 [Lasiodiplodia mahajangana]|uniref:Uncharacterized protein n=1 Tax=Lasiodiplodia mahajangana TaxID=1108764 RepID=A0ACC2JPD7_9PEZI|nr:hypothetical protein O1611_g4337 [Lasiodiplodia mahajangana]
MEDLTQIHNLPQAEQDAILAGPALALPPGIPEPRFDNPPNGDALAYTAVSLCLVASTLAVLVRFYAKCIRVKKITIEESLMVGAYGVFVGYIYITYWLLDIVGFFVHQWDVRLRDFWTLLYIIHVGSNFYSVTMLVMKALILREWSRIFVPYGMRTTFWWTCHVVMAVNVIFYAAAIFLEDLSCFPYRRIWDKTVAGSQCLDFKIIVLIGASINVVLDVTTLILPQKAIWSLQLSRNKKIGVSLVFAIGILACAAAISRLVYTVFYFRSDDTAYTLSALSLWLIAEMTCMFLIFAGPATPSAFARAEWVVKLKRTFKSWSKGSSKQPTDVSDRPWSNQKADAMNLRKAYRKIDEFELLNTNATSVGGNSHTGFCGGAAGLCCVQDRHPLYQGIHDGGGARRG